MNVYYSASTYGSHLRVAKTYRALIGGLLPLVDSLAAARVVVLHHEPRDFTALFEQYPALQKRYVIGYCVWESTELPRAYQESIRHLHEVWTPSTYSKAAFDEHHPNVHRIPHVIERDTRFTEADLERVKRQINYDPSTRYYLAVALQANKRKNLAALVRAFNDLRSKMPNAKLVLKTDRFEDPTGSTNSAVIRLPGAMRWAEVNALYHLATAYVSAHHAEGWGLTLSDAMVFGKPVIATGYSGNLEFMNDRNSFLVDFAEERIRDEDCDDLFHSGMKWAYPDETDLRRKLLAVHEQVDAELIRNKVQQASHEIKAFDGPSVSEMIRRRLNAIR